jgi:hypothetical protein
VISSPKLGIAATVPVDGPRGTCALLEIQRPRRPPTRRLRDRADLDAIASQLLRYRDERGDDWADIIDMLTMHPERRRWVVRLLGELSTER